MHSNLTLICVFRYSGLQWISEDNFLLPLFFLYLLLGILLLKGLYFLSVHSFNNLFLLVWTHEYLLSHFSYSPILLYFITQAVLALVVGWRLCSFGIPSHHGFLLFLLSLLPSLPSILLDATHSSYVFPASVIEFVFSSVNSESFYWRMTLANKIGSSLSIHL